MRKQVIHGIEITETYWPAREADVKAQHAGNVRGNHFLFIERVSQGGTTSYWEAHEYSPDQLAYRGGMTEYSRELPSLMQLVIDGVELRSMIRLEIKPPTLRRNT